MFAAILLASDQRRINRDHKEAEGDGLGPDIRELGAYSMLIPIIVGEDHVADNWFGCAANGWEESEIDRDSDI